MADEELVSGRHRLECDLDDDTWSLQSDVPGNLDMEAEMELEESEILQEESCIVRVFCWEELAAFIRVVENA